MVQLILKINSKNLEDKIFVYCATTVLIMDAKIWYQICCRSIAKDFGLMDSKYHSKACWNGLYQNVIIYKIKKKSSLSWILTKTLGNSVQKSTQNPYAQKRTRIIFLDKWKYACALIPTATTQLHWIQQQQVVVFEKKEERKDCRFSLYTFWFLCCWFNESLSFILPHSYFIPTRTHTLVGWPTGRGAIAVTSTKPDLFFCSCYDMKQRRHICNSFSCGNAY